MSVLHRILSMCGGHATKGTGPRLRRKPETDPVQTLFYSSVNGMGAGTFSRFVLS